jgi:hypothetical protein
LKTFPLFALHNLSPVPCEPNNAADEVRFAAPSTISFFGVAKQFQTVEVEMVKRRNCRVPTAQFGRRGNTIQALLWARPGAEA